MHAREPDLRGVDLQGLDPTLRAQLSTVWTRRTAAELGVASYVRTMVTDLAGAGADENVLSLGARVIADEDRHARVCLAIAGLYAGRNLPPPPELNPTFEPLDRVSQPLRASLRVLGMCCIGETLAAAWMDTSLGSTAAPWLRPWVRQHFSDEVHHAQLGWAHFASTAVTRDQRAAAAKFLVPLVRANLNSWLGDPEPFFDGLEEHGIPSNAQNHAIVSEAMRSLVIPGLRRVGIDVGELEDGLPELLAAYPCDSPVGSSQ